MKRQTKRINHYFTESLGRDVETCHEVSRMWKDQGMCFGLIGFLKCGEDLWFDGYRIAERLTDEWLAENRCKLITNMLPSKR